MANERHVSANEKRNINIYFSHFINYNNRSDTMSYATTENVTEIYAEMTEENEGYSEFSPYMIRDIINFSNATGKATI